MKTSPPRVVRPKKEAMPESERMILLIGLVLALFFATGFGLFVYAVARGGGADASASLSDSPSLPIAPDYPRHLVDFSLVDQSGHPLTRQDLRNKIVVVNFIFTSCSVVCPYVNAQMEKIQRSTAGEPDVRLLSLAVDPADDTVAVLASYGQAFDQDKSRWSFLTGDKQEMQRLVGTSFLSPDTTGDFSYMPGAFAHTERIALVDAKGHVVEYFDGLNQETADAVIKEIGKLRGTHS